MHIIVQLQENDTSKVGKAPCKTVPSVDAGHGKSNKNVCIFTIIIIFMIIIMWEQEHTKPSAQSCV